MARYRKRPVVIDAVQFRAGEQSYEMDQLTGGSISGMISYPEDGTMLISTLEGTMIARSGDWIIRGLKGELYPCNPEIFEATYEEVL